MVKVLLAAALASAALPANVAVVEPAGRAQLPKTDTLWVAVQSFGDKGAYKLSVSGFPAAKPMPRKPKSAAPKGAIGMIGEPSWREQEAAARAAGKGAPGARAPKSAKRTKPPAPGARERFFVMNRTGKPDGDVATTLKLTTANTNWWVDDALKVDMQALTQAATYFEQKSYKRVRKVFGKELLRVDGGDSRLNFVVTPLTGVGGYFWSANLNPSAFDHAGVGRKVLVIADSWMGHPGLDACLAHEFQHLVCYSRKLKVDAAEESWVNEGLAVLAADVAGKGAMRGDATYLYCMTRWLADTAALPLEMDVHDAPDKAASYGRSYLFARYLADRFGEAIVADILKSEKTGRAGIAKALEARGTSFDAVWRDWAVALTAAGGVKQADARFQFKSLDFAKPIFKDADLDPQDHKTPTAAGKLTPYTIRYHRFRAAKPQTWDVQLTGDGVRAVVVAAPGR